MIFAIPHADRNCELAAYRVFYLPWHRSPRAQTQALVIFGDLQPMM